MKYVCKTSGVEFETDQKIVFNPRHPAISEFQRGTSHPMAAVSRAFDVVRAEGGYSTIEEYIALVDQKAPDIKQQMDDEWAQKQVEREAANQREAERRAANEAAHQQKLRADGLKPGASRQAQNALLKAYGYTWKKVYVVDEFDPDEGDEKWILSDPDGASISLYRALDEIKRGREVVRAEMAAKAEEAKAAEAKREVEREIKRQQDAEAKARSDASLEILDAMVAKIEAGGAEKIPYTEGRELKVEWSKIATVEAFGLYRYHDRVEKASAGDGRYYYLVVLNTGYDDDGFYTYYKSQSDLTD
jgi:hypothetical protein